MKCGTNIENCLDPVLIELLSKVRERYDVKFEKHHEPWAANYTINNYATIYYNPRRFSNDSIAHELLHVWLKTLGYFGSNHIYCVAEEDYKLSRIFSKNLCDHIGNCQDHIKMYPKYLEMGYAPEVFIENSLKEQCSIRDIASLCVVSGKIIFAGQTDFFIGSLISIYAHHIQMDYSAHLSKLKSIDSELFQIVTVFWEDWKRFDITKVDAFNSGFDEYERFISAMREWVKDRAII